MLQRSINLFVAGIAAVFLASCATGAVSPSISSGAVSRSAPSTRYVAKNASVYHLLYSFAGGDPQSDGATPVAGLTELSGALYGTTEYGGLYNDGAVFKITKSGKESIVHSFPGSPDGEFPFAGLTDVNGTLYGTTAGGGSNTGGTIFKTTPSGNESVVLSFAGPNGLAPHAGLIDIDGSLYGTTYESASLDGTVFGFNLKSKTFSLFYAFLGGSDGAFPEAGVTKVNGVLYGTTLAGGGNANYGTVFKINRSSQRERILFRFTSPTKQGANSYAGLTDVSGVLYGTTGNGGASDMGTVFSITTSGSEALVHSFTGGPQDGEEPFAGLLDVNGVLYGTTYMVAITATERSSRLPRLARKASSTVLKAATFRTVHILRLALST